MTLLELPAELFEQEIVQRRLDVTSAWLLGCTCRHLYQRVIVAGEMEPPSKEVEVLSTAPLVLARRMFKRLQREARLDTDAYYHYAMNPDHDSMDELVQYIPKDEQDQRPILTAPPPLPIRAGMGILAGLAQMDRIDLLDDWFDHYFDVFHQTLQSFGPLHMQDSICHAFRLKLLTGMLQSSRHARRWYHMVSSCDILQQGSIRSVVSTLQTWEDRDRFVDIAKSLPSLKFTLCNFLLGSSRTSLERMNVSEFYVYISIALSHDSVVWVWEMRSRWLLPSDIERRLVLGNANWIEAYVRLLPREDWPERVAEVATRYAKLAPESWQRLKSAGLLSYAHVPTNAEELRNHVLDCMWSEAGHDSMYMQFKYLKRFGTEGIARGAEMLAALKSVVPFDSRDQCHTASGVPYWDD